MRAHRNEKRRRVHALWQEQAGLLRGFVVDALTALVLGVVLIVGGRQHAQATAWDLVNANGGPAPWGVVLLVLGAAMVAATFVGPRAVTMAMWALALFYIVIGIAFAVAVWNDPDHGASYFGTVLVTRAAVMHVSRAQAYRDGPRWTD